ncbi:MAG: dTDP-4-dehydrorhamnose reductase [Oscillospiraceae bacterium]|nr:dTDP-4-dehydrorhamnose reductase [Oscillospiraceae bacterium]
MKVLVTGAKGQLGSDIEKHFIDMGHEVIGIDKDSLDLTNQMSVRNYIRIFSPELVIHCAAYTAVDKAEDEREEAYAVNVTATEHVASVCNEIGCAMVYFSTDYVFDGGGIEEWRPGDECNPINYYGKTKWLGENAVKEIVKKHYIIRVSWLFGKNGGNFVKTMLWLGDTGKTLKIIDDQIGSPTFTEDIAEAVHRLVDTGAEYGIYHLTNEGYCSWYEFARKIFELSGKEVSVTPITTDEYPTNANRPQNSRMSKEKLYVAGVPRMPTWQDALERYFA